jgi:hypothetical protein
MVSLDVATRNNAVTRVFGKEMREGWDRVTMVMQEARGCAESELNRSWGEHTQASQYADAKPEDGDCRSVGCTQERGCEMGEEAIKKGSN